LGSGRCVAAVLAIVASDRLISLSTQPELPRYSFAVNIEGKVLSAFREVTGLDVELEVVDFSEGTGHAALQLVYRVR
jgi:hypothetical protein